MKYVFLLLLFSHLAQAQVIYIAHRGASHLAPENTLASIQLAWDLNSRAAECDILLTKDEQIIVFHDKNTSRLLGKNQQIKQSNYTEINSDPIRLKSHNLKKYAGETIPLLKDVLQTIPDSATLVIEIKCGQEIIQPLKKIIHTHWKQGSIAFICFGYETILATKEQFPNIPCYFLAHGKGSLNKYTKELISSSLDGIDLHHNIINKRLVKRFKKHHKAIWCYTVNHVKEAIRMRKCGVTGITTNRPKWLKETVKNTIKK